MPLSKVLYLGPALEGRSLDVVVASVAHELAHIQLGHSLMNTPEQYSAQEEEAWKMVRDWGFEKEERAHREFYRKYHARERALIRKLSRMPQKLKRGARRSNE